MLSRTHCERQWELLYMIKVFLRYLTIFSLTNFEIDFFFFKSTFCDNIFLRRMTILLINLENLFRDILTYIILYRCVFSICVD